MDGFLEMHKNRDKKDRNVAFNVSGNQKQKKVIEHFERREEKMDELVLKYKNMQMKSE